jgi:hypothetical protein
MCIVYEDTVLDAGHVKQLGISVAFGRFDNVWTSLVA